VVLLVARRAFHRPPSYDDHMGIRIRTMDLSARDLACDKSADRQDLFGPEADARVAAMKRDADPR
jgi:hypothetical protein